MLFTAMSYGHLVRKFPSAGSAYTYAQKVFHPMWASWWAGSPLLDYMFMPMINMLGQDLHGGPVPEPGPGPTSWP